jgi:hypothetical protein
MDVLDAQSNRDSGIDPFPWHVTLLHASIAQINALAS